MAQTLKSDNGCWATGACAERCSQQLPVKLFV
jgi:hypothetical protein